MTDPTTNPEPTGLMHGAVFFGEEADEADKKAEAASEATTATPDVAKLQGQVEALSKQLEQMQQDKMTLMMQAGQPSVQQVPVPALEAPKPLTDPLQDSEAFANELADKIEKRVEARMNAATTQASAQQSATTKYNDLWTSFKSQHKEHAADFRQVQYAANLAAGDLTKRGIDVERYMFTYQDQFMQDVIAKMDEIFGKPGTKVNEAPPKDPEAIRTGGMFGGIDSGGKPEAPMEPDNAFSDIRKWQEETGFHP